MKVIKLDAIDSTNEFLKGYRMFRVENLYWLLLRDSNKGQMVLFEL
jgi:hypothetical protein